MRQICLIGIPFGCEVCSQNETREGGVILTVSFPLFSVSRNALRTCAETEWDSLGHFSRIQLPLVDSQFLIVCSHDQTRNGEHSNASSDCGGSKYKPARTERLLGA